MPESDKRAILVRVEGGLSDSEEFPAATLQLPLSLHVRFITVSSVPFVTVAFDGQPCLTALNHYINSLARNFMLWHDYETFAKQYQRNVNLEPALEWRWRIHNAPIILCRSPL